MSGEREGEATAAPSTPGPAPGAVAAPSGRGEVVSLLLRAGVLSEAQVHHAERVQAKLAGPRPLLPLLLELELISEERLRAALRSHRLSLRIGTLLHELGAIGPQELEVALALQGEEGDGGRKLGEILVDCGFLAEHTLAEVLAGQLGMPLVAATALEPEPALLARAGAEPCRRHRFLPLAREGDAVRVAFADPLDKADAAAAEACFEAPVLPAVAAPSALDAVLSRLSLRDRVAAGGAGAEAVAEAVLAEWLGALARREVEAVHVEPSRAGLRVRLRRGGPLGDEQELPAELAAPLFDLLERRAGLEAERGLRYRAGRIEDGPGEVSVHVAQDPRPGREAAVLRVAGGVPPVRALDALGLSEAMARRLERHALGPPGGLLLLAGPAGSGRSTTLHALADRLSAGHGRVLLPGHAGDVGPATGRPGEDAGLATGRARPGTARGVRAGWLDALGQDPDAVGLDPLVPSREREASQALVAARRGVRVWAVVHAEDGVDALLALVAGLRGAVPAVLRGALSQRLVRQVCEACATEHVPTAAELAALGLSAVDLAGGRFRRGRGCSACRETGHAGRQAVFELLLLDEPSRDRLREGARAAVLRRNAAQVGPATLLEAGILLAAEGRTTLAECLRALPRPLRPRSLAELRAALEEAS